MRFSEYEECHLCHRSCGVNRYEKNGFCKVPADIYIARAALHKWEEPPISGEYGSGTIFFAGCSLGCVFCQNREISRGINGKCVSVEQLTEIMIKLQKDGAHNINLVTPTHYVPSIIAAVKLAKQNGLKIPIVYNTGSYDTKETICSLEGIVDIYLPDLKYYKSSTSKKYSLAENYIEASREAIEEMYRQKGTPLFDENGMLKSGVVVRILLLP